jgi:hypothetical protein
MREVWILLLEILTAVIRTLVTARGDNTDDMPITL